MPSRSLSARRAWIEIAKVDDTLAGVPSLSARRAWIEMKKSTKPLSFSRVALRKESVDRNWKHWKWLFHLLRSLSARRAWIEISVLSSEKIRIKSLSARRAWIEI